MWVQENKKSTRAILEILVIAKNARTPVQFASKKTLDKISHQANHQGFAIRRKVTLIENKMDLKSVLAIDDGTKPLFLVLDGVQNPLPCQSGI